VPLLLLLFIVVPLVELFVIIEVGQAIGAVPTITILFLDSILGAVLLRSQGRAAWQRFNLALAERRVPHREVFDGVLIIFGGALLLTPGFITDIVGPLLLIPPTRAAIRGSMASLVRRRMARGGRAVFWGYERFGPRPGAPQPRAPGQTAPPRAGSPYDYEGTAREVRDEDELSGPTDGDGRR
jgi:UPF0716 protein FxsA